ncbi:hypothetical protein LMG27952_05281 [Paraburkholderia hiiakae]|uniref:Uncharacterized protein n=1 Tax=Paraburkholderia hiiakae TaxID=1081782 RepID=A0ABM8P0R9_9BURK|nr:hypothetical protein LMG27952_05281 [Paraburkholderia hiiakae]
MRNPKRHWLVRYWFYIPFWISVALSVFVVAGLGGIDEILDPYYIRVFVIPLLFLLGVSGGLGLFVHIFVMSCRNSAD